MTAVAFLAGTTATARRVACRAAAVDLCRVP
jgi:hypothetical protein